MSSISFGLTTTLFLQSLELGESLQLRLLETEGKLNQLKLQKDIPMMVLTYALQMIRFLNFCV